MPRKYSVIAVLLVAALGVALLVTGYKAGLTRTKELADAHFESRATAILSQAKQREWPIVVLGDSHTELAMIDRLCGKPVLNAGISGARIGRMAKFGSELLREIEPSLVIVALGTNDAWAHDPTETASFEADYRKLLDEARLAGATVVALTVPPVANEGMGRASAFDPAVILARNRTIESLNVPVIDVAKVLSDEDGSLPPEFTDDGVHPNKTGYDLWKERLSRACQISNSRLASRSP